jgi:hypothetical protein
LRTAKRACPQGDLIFALISIFPLNLGLNLNPNLNLNLNPPPRPKTHPSVGLRTSAGWAQPFQEREERSLFVTTESTGTTEESGLDSGQNGLHATGSSLRCRFMVPWNELPQPASTVSPSHSLCPLW